MNPGLTVEIERLREFVRYYARCECCEQVEKCYQECTMHDDDRTRFEEIQYARMALFGVT